MGWGGKGKGFGPMGKGWGKGHWGPPPVAAAVAAGVAAGVAVAAVAVAAPAVAVAGGIALLTTRVLRGPRHPRPWGKGKGKGKPVVVVVAEPARESPAPRVVVPSVQAVPSAPPEPSAPLEEEDDTITVAVPPGTAPGTLLQFENPRTGQLMQVAVPEGAVEEMEVRLA